MKKIVKALAIAITTFGHTAFATTGGTSTLFLNGIQNTRPQAVQNLLTLQKARISETSESGHGGPTRYGLLYNNSDGVGDFIEVIKQKLQEQFAIDASYTQLWLWALRVQQPTQQFTDLETAYFNNLEVARRIISAGGADISQQKVDLIAELKAGNRALVVAHSQGTLFANTLYTSVFSSPQGGYCEKNVGSVFVGTAAGKVVSSRVPGHGSWFTFSDDLVIQGLRLASASLGISVLPSNLGFFGENRTRFGVDLLGHGFKDAYMLASDSHATIVNEANSMAKRLTYPTDCGGGIVDLSAATSDSAALADLINDANNLDPTPVDPGKALYLEGAGLGGAQFEVPGVTGRLRASAVNLPTDHPLYVAGSEVWKLTIPASAVAGSSGKVRAIIAIDGVEQSFESPRSIVIKASSGAQMNYTKYLVMKAGYPSTNPAGLCAGAYRQNIPAAQVATYSLVELLEIKSGPDTGRIYRTETEDSCTYNTVGPITVSQLSVVPTRFGAPIAQFTVQYTLIYSPEFGYNPADSPTVTQGASLFKEYTMRSDGRCDIRSFNAGYLRSVSQTTDKQYTDTTVYEITGGSLSSSYLQLNLHEGEQPAVDSCNDERITRLKSPANERVQVN